MIDKEEKIALKYLKSHNWSKVKGHCVSHEGFSDEFERTYWKNKDFMDFVRPCTFYQDNDGDDVFEDIWDAVEHVEGCQEQSFEKYKTSLIKIKEQTAEENK